MSEIVKAERVGLLKPVVTPAELIDNHKQVVDFITKGLDNGSDYGTVPGISKPFLWKAGAERLCRAYNLVPKFEIMQFECEHDRVVKHQRGTSYGFYRYVVKCRLELPNGSVVGEGLGSASTMESKYIQRPRDLENTILKMAKKRAQVDAVLTVLGLSNRFNQDLEQKTGEPEDDDGPGIYTGTKEQKMKLWDGMKVKEVPREKYPLVHEAMLNKPFTDEQFLEVLTEILKH